MPHGLYGACKPIDDIESEYFLRIPVEDRPGVIAQISVLHRDGSTQRLTTDGSWRVARGAWLPGTQRDLEGDLVDFTENIDGPSQPIGWDTTRFDDRHWSPATVLGPAGVAPWAHLVPVRTRIVIFHQYLATRLRRHHADCKRHTPAGRSDSASILLVPVLYVGPVA